MLKVEDDEGFWRLLFRVISKKLKNVFGIWLCLLFLEKLVYVFVIIRLLILCLCWVFVFVLISSYDEEDEPTYSQRLIFCGIVV